MIRRKAAAAAAAVTLALAVIGGGAAYAASAGKPGDTCPAYGECNYPPGTVVYLCVNQQTEAVRAEVNSDVPDNCAAGEIQLGVVVEQGAYPSQSP